MSEQLKVRMHRVPLPGVDVQATQPIRDGMIADVTERASQTGSVAASLRFLSNGLVEEARLSEMSDASPAQIAAFFLGAARRRGVVRSFRVGVAALPGAHGPEKSAVVLELMPDGGWWLAHRPLSDDAEAGFLSGEWRTQAGDSKSALLPELRLWLDAGALTVNDVDARWVRRSLPKPPSIGMAHLHLDTPIDGDPLAIARRIGPTVDRQILEHGLPGVIVLVFRGHTLQRWDISGPLPCSIDDLVRGACAGGTCDAVAVIYGSEVTLDGQTMSGVVMMVERDGRRARRALPLDTSDGSPRALPARVRELAPVTAVTGWIGVAPESGLELVALASPSVAPEA